MKLQWKILLPIIVLFVVVLSASAYISYKRSADVLEENTIAGMKGEAEALKRMTASVLGESARGVERVAGEGDLHRFYESDIENEENGKAFAAWLELQMKSYPDISRFNVFNMEGRIVSSSNPAVIGQDFKSRPYFQVPAREGKSFVSAPFKSTITGQGVIIVSSPVKRGNAVIGVVNATIDLPGYFEAAIKPVKIADHGYAYAMDTAGVIVAHPDPKWVFNDAMPAAEAYRQMAAAPDGVMEFVNNLGVESFAFHVKDPFSGMVLVVQADRDDVFEKLGALAQSSIIVALIGIAIGIIVLLCIVRPIVNALKRGVSYATEIAAGKLDGQLLVHRKDEIGTLADALRGIPESLKAIIAEYSRLENDLVYGDIKVQGDASRFSGDFANLMRGTNATLSRYQLILDSLTSPVVVLDKELHITYMNDAGRAIGGNDYLHKRCGEVMAREDDGTANDALAKAAKSLAPASGETVAHPQGRRFDISYTAIPFKDKNGKLAAVLQLITDLTSIKSTQRTILDVASQAQDISERVASASEQLSAQVEQVSKGSDVQRDRAGSTATAMEEMTSTIVEVARNAGEASHQGESTRAKAAEGSSLVSKVVAAINQVNVVASALQENMQHLGQQAESIGSVMNVISDIADQTNLLALNAAIEAARAGEAGRGFAVVADEVRKLAEKTMTATTEVGSSIKGIQSSTAANIERVSEAAEGVKNATELATVSGEALSEIQQLVSTNSELVASIATAAEEQSATAEEINRSIDDINRVAGETAAGMEESAAAVRDLSEMARQLKDLLDRLRQ